MKLSRKLASEFLGTAALLATIVGSGIMAERLANGNAAVALLANSIAICAGLLVLIYCFAAISGSHFNPVVTLTENLRGRIELKDALFYILAQIAGAVLGVVLANLMFELPAVNMSAKIRGGAAIYFSEFIATFGLIAVIRLGVRFHPHLVGAMVALYILAACWFTSSTSFANPAVSIARTLSNTFTGIAPENVPMFIVSEIAGAVAAMLFFNWLLLEVETDE
jgi:glycerol uptake facilitator-like aquaporin